MESCLYSLLGRDVAKDMLRCESRAEGMAVKGFVSSPAAGRGNRSAQYFYCNGRYIKSPLLQAAVEQAYKNSLLTGRYPACVLYLELSFGSVEMCIRDSVQAVYVAQVEFLGLVYIAQQGPGGADGGALFPQAAVVHVLEAELLAQSGGTGHIIEALLVPLRHGVQLFQPEVRYRAAGRRPRGQHRLPGRKAAQLLSLIHI